VTDLEAAALSQMKELPSREARDAARVFFQALASRTSLHGITPHTPGPKHTGEVRVVAATSRIAKPDDSATEALLRAISGARQSIMIESPYFVLTPRVFQALDDAERRGVSITVLTNSPLSSDNPPSQALFIDTWPELMARLRSLQIFVPADTRMLHAKRAVFDEDLTLIGPYNIDPVSAEMNSELVLCVWSKSFNGHNRRELMDTIVRRGLLEYRIARDASHHAVRHRSGDPHAGEVVVVFGPRDHTPPELIDRLTTLKPVLLGLRSLWDFDVVVW
jgi:putative cardiolipin synthase